MGFCFGSFACCDVLSGGLLGLEISQLVKTAEVQKYDGECSTTYPGKIKAASDVQLAFRVAGPILRFNAEVGEFVKKGEVLAEIDPRLQITVRGD